MKNKVALIIGARGQDGFYLNNLLHREGFEIIKTSRKDIYLPGNVGDFNFVENLIRKFKPNFIFHLAANSTTRHHALFENYDSISTGTLNILECVKLHCPDTKVFLSGSALQFKNDGLPINEQTQFEANSSYSVARIQSVYTARYYRKTFGLRVYIGYFFNHDSSLRSEEHINQKIVKTAIRIAYGSKETLVVGDTEVKKEFNYAGDIVEALWILVNQEKIYEAAIGNGIAYRIQDWVAYCFRKMKLKWQDHLVLDQNFIPEYKILVSDPKLIMSLGWKPKLNFNKLANRMLKNEY